MLEKRNGVQCFNYLRAGIDDNLKQGRSVVVRCAKNGGSTTFNLGHECGGLRVNGGLKSDQKIALLPLIL
jgi:hypothetical protein